jgi:hypothetical protein
MIKDYMKATVAIVAMGLWAIFIVPLTYSPMFLAYQKLTGFGIMR